MPFLEINPIKESIMGHQSAKDVLPSMGVGDPACDYAMAWTYFNGKSRKIFLQGLDSDAINRARGWALWKALLTYHAPDAPVADNAQYTVRVIIEEYDAKMKENVR